MQGNWKIEHFPIPEACTLYTCYVLNFDLIEALDRLRFGDFSRGRYLSLYLQGKKHRR
jgi:hypothetical protein